ncbi:MAG: hypothetical protein KJ622_10280 [Alphaproteobacteria bacterium]|nr:hypothetical protein [Alphaproteobacteria bacterium]
MFRKLFTGGAIVAAVLLSGLIGSAQAAGPDKVWEWTKAYGPECVFFDPNEGVLYVTHGNNDAMKKDGDGYVSKHSLDGKVIAEKWATGLDAPKGMDIANGHMFVGDVDTLVEIDLKDGSIVAKHAAPDAKLLNDVAADSGGAVYVSDTMGNQIFRLSGGKIESWLKTDEIAGPNGLLVEGGNLIVNSWGVLSGNGWETSVKGSVYSVSLADKAIKPLSGKPVGNLDAMQPLGDGAFLLGDFWVGKILKFAADGSVSEVAALEQGTADFDYDPATKTVFVPNMMKGSVTAYKIAP